MIQKKQQNKRVFKIQNVTNITPSWWEKIALLFCRKRYTQHFGIGCDKDGILVYKMFRGRLYVVDIIDYDLKK